MSAPEPQPTFLFVVAQPEAKSWLLAELGREHPELRPAYSRAGLYTFKPASGELSVSFRLRSVFARHCGFGIGLVNDPEQLASAIQACFGPTNRKLRLHVFARDAGESRPRASLAVLDDCRNLILAQLPTCFHAEVTPQTDDWVLDVIVPPDVDGNKPWFVGYHRHQRHQSPHPGAVARRTPPAWAPSRAWSKLEELLSWSSLPLRSGDVALEFGCAPGGAVVSLLDRGVTVVGVDPGQMDPRVFEHTAGIAAEFRHVACPVAALERGQVPPKVDWLLCDANLAPQIAIRYLAYWSKQLRPNLRGLVFTLKLNDQRVVDAIPKFLGRVAEFGLGEPRAVQLPSHRREIVVYAARQMRGPRSGKSPKRF